MQSQFQFSLVFTDNTYFIDCIQKVTILLRFVDQACYLLQDVVEVVTKRYQYHLLFTRNLSPCSPNCPLEILPKKRKHFFVLFLCKNTSDDLKLATAVSALKGIVQATCLEIFAKNNPKYIHSFLLRNDMICEKKIYICHFELSY